MKIRLFIAVCMLLSFSFLTEYIEADPRAPSPPRPMENERVGGETVFKWEGRLGFIELKTGGVLETPFGVYYRAIGGLYPKWYGKDGYIILKDDRLWTPFGLYRPFYY